MDIRVGHGYDLHRLATKEQDGRPMVLGGVPIECRVGPVAHSDGDAVLHAVTDALLGAIGHPDIGQLFPDSDKEHEGADSSAFLIEAVSRLNEGGWAICNVDISVICDEPRIGDWKEQMCSNIRTLIGAPVNIKGKTHEGTEQCEVIKVHVVALVQRSTQE